MAGRLGKSSKFSFSRNPRVKIGLEIEFFPSARVKLYRIQ